MKYRRKALDLRYRRGYEHARYYPTHLLVYPEHLAGLVANTRSRNTRVAAFARGFIAAFLDTTPRD